MSRAERRSDQIERLIRQVRGEPLVEITFLLGPIKYEHQNVEPPPAPAPPGSEPGGARSSREP